MMETVSPSSLFLYHYFESDTWDRLQLLFYTKTRNHQNVILETTYQPFFYVEFPDSFLYPKDKCSFTQVQSPVLSMSMNRRIAQKLVVMMGYHESSHCSTVGKGKEGCKYCWKGKFLFESRQKLYFVQQRSHRYFLKISFPSLEQRQKAVYKLHEKMMMMEQYKIFLRVHEQKAPAMLQFCSEYQLRTVGWVKVKIPKRVLSSSLPIKIVSVEGKLMEMDETQSDVLFPSVCSIDIEVYSSNPKRMPDASEPMDCIFQIALIWISSEKQMFSTMLCLGGNGKNEVSKRTSSIRNKYGQGRVWKETEKEEWILYENEEDLLLGFQRWVQEWNPDVLMGYNVMGFDFPYMMDRCDYHHISSEVFCLGRRFPQRICPCPEIDWSSSAYRHQHFKFWDMDGRIVMDLLPVVRRDYKLENYKLDTVCQTFLSSSKDPITPQDIFKSYAGYIQEGWTVSTQKQLWKVGKYCLKDAQLVYQLFDKLQLWLSLTEMARLCNVSITALFTKGQQIKVYSQIYRFCRKYQRLVETTPRSLLDFQEGYTGATVFPPKPGLYDNVLPFDFSSLYPTTIIAFNIDYSTFVPETRQDIADEKCHVISWEEHTGCDHDTTKYTESKKPKYPFCGEHRYRFLKSPKGVLPSVLEHLLDARKETKRQMKQHSPESLSYQILDKRQLALKISANSMYGAMGVTKGYLPFMYGAMCTTAQGRHSIQKAADYVQRVHHGHIVYGDSVSKTTPIMIQEKKKKDKVTIRIMDCETFFREYEQRPEVEYFEQDMMTNPKKDDMKMYLDTSNLDLSIWTESGWTRVERCMKHSTTKKMYRVFSTYGWVDVTEDHSLLRQDGSVCSPQELVPLQDELLHSFGIASEMNHTNTTCSIPDSTSSLLSFSTSGRVGFQLGYILSPTSSLPPSILHTTTIHPLTSHVTSFVYFMNQLVSFGKPQHLKRFVRGFCQASGSFPCRIPIQRLLPFPVLWQSLWIVFTRMNLTTYLTDIRSISEGTWVIEEMNPTHDKYSHDNKNQKKNQVLGVFPLSSFPCQEEEEVYDFTTKNHHFQAGIGYVIVHNTDSIYCRFPLQPVDQLWKFAKMMEKEFLSLFPPPQKLVFEEKLYRRFLILTKKRYMALTCDETESHDDELTIRGVLLARRDNCHWIRRVYERIVRSMLNGQTYRDILDMIVQEYLFLYRGEWTLDQFIVTKLVGKDYKIRDLPEDEKKCEKRLSSLHIFHRDSQGKWKEEYKEKNEPAHVQLAKRIQRRGGEPFEPGVRIPYVIIRHPDGNKAKLFEKTEDPLYVLQRFPILTIDTYHYGKLLAKALDQLLEVCFPEWFSKHVCMRTEWILHQHEQWKNVRRELETMFGPRVSFPTSSSSTSSSKNIIKKKEKKTKVVSLSSSSISVVPHTTSLTSLTSSTSSTLSKKSTQKSIYDFLV